MTGSMPVNPAILKWARETAGFSIEDAAKKLKRKRINVDTLAAWERGEQFPTYSQLERLAYEIYRRPLAIFFFPEPPQEETPRESFRTLPEEEIRRMTAKMRFLVKQARSMQISLDELNEGKNPAARIISRALVFRPDISLKDMVSSVRAYLGIAIGIQLQWRSAEKAFSEWRTAIESHGIFIFKDAFKDDNISGFCLYDKNFSIIYVNNSKPATRQIFTLFHELAHLLFRTGGIDASDEGYIHLLKGADRQIEVQCNRFAGAFLVPDENFNPRIKKLSITDSAISELANLYSVSREVILRKLFDRKLISQSFYDRMVKKWREEFGEKSGSGGDYYLTKRVYLGERYLELAFSRYYQNRLSLEQLADHLGVKVKYVNGMESLLLSKGINS